MSIACPGNPEHLPFGVLCCGRVGTSNGSVSEQPCRVSTRGQMVEIVTRLEATLQHENGTVRLAGNDVLHRPHPIWIGQVKEVDSAMIASEISEFFQVNAERHGWAAVVVVDEEGG